MKFDDGQAVKISKTAPKHFYMLGEIGSICGMDKIRTNQRSLELEVPVGSIVYLVEAPCGKSIEVPEIHLSKL
ncbi:hypothetical protein [Cochlodiniinecator piscidefendens]|uniref:hypothetical protein n=1 Tax=Cochlodiniinecator piscidefendens TaxID=2715756 RepID=UPI0014099CFA|nr:hypothetical protein [Cochlodiniinecator piscidefendens]